MARRWGKRRDDGGSMLATVVTIVLGTGLCCFLCLIDSSSDFSAFMLTALPIVAVLAIYRIAVYRYGRGDSGSMAFWHSAASNHNDDGIAAQYRPRKVKDGGASTPAGTNTPITAEEAHDIQVTSANTWVPSKNRRNEQE